MGSKVAMVAVLRIELRSQRLDRLREAIREVPAVGLTCERLDLSECAEQVGRGGPNIRSVPGRGLALGDQAIGDTPDAPLGSVLIPYLPARGPEATRTV